MISFCPHCLEVKSTTEFYVCKSGRPSSYCKECLVEYRKVWYTKNREHQNQTTSAWAKNNPEKQRHRVRQYRAKHTKRMRELDREAQRRRWQNDPQHRLASALRNRFRAMLRSRKINKGNSALVLLGCSMEVFKVHIEARFQAGMSWENWGKGADKWNIDHIRPCASFPDLSDPAQQSQCFHYTNLQPLWQPENGSKGAKYEGVDYRGK